MARPNLPPPTEAEDIARARIPREGEVLGKLEQRLGGSRCRVRCLDSKERICRIPGRLKKSLWVREGDTVLVKPWELGGDTKGDIIFKYKPNQAAWLQRQGYLADLADMDGF